MKNLKEIFGYINSDDYLLKNCLTDVAEIFKKYPDADIIYGNGYIVDKMSNFTKRMISKEFSMKKYKYGRSLICQQATFFRSMHINKLKVLM